MGLTTLDQAVFVFPDATKAELFSTLCNEVSLCDYTIPQGNRVGVGGITRMVSLLQTVALLKGERDFNATLE